MKVNVHIVFSTDIASRVCSTFLHSDLAETKLHPTLKNLIIDVFEARWKKDADPNNFGRKFFGSENCHRVEYVETVVENAARYCITHRPMMKEE